MAGRHTFGKVLRAITDGPPSMHVISTGSRIRINMDAQRLRAGTLNARNRNQPRWGPAVHMSPRMQSGAPQAHATWNQRSGFATCWVPLSPDLAVTMMVDLSEYTLDRLSRIQEATQTGDLKKQAREVFRIVVNWDLRTDTNRIAVQDHKTLAELPEGFALAIVIEIGNRTGVIGEPIRSGIVMERDG